MRRTKDWRKPAGVLYVGRPGRFGNPWEWMTFGREGAVDLYRRWLAGELSESEQRSLGLDIDGDRVERQRRRILDGLAELRGHDLGCWCPLDQPCHADALLELANKPAAANG